ncbi:hypothetical protein K9857_04850 [Pseudomonas sp. REP124]|uniref:hypothetical protein n=1 Tax=Pseudomonas sp. REP124 TaxID=2875731 RepID=UPI001CC9A909|nr:hypothetical protein [Pseudomonas sp. REP124]MBZ9780878.1 hypothetical protein [Pseudomonas sp. REP124]
MSEQFEREDRYIVLKLKRLPSYEVAYLQDRHAKAMVECVVVEHDWPEYNLVWAMIEHRMAGEPVPDFNLWRRANELQERLNVADQRIDELSGVLALAAISVDYHAGMKGEDGQHIYDLLSQIRAELKPVEREPYQGIPGTSFQRLNMLANQGE